jgi:hypothetical protein
MRRGVVRIVVCAFVGIATTYAVAAMSAVWAAHVPYGSAGSSGGRVWAQFLSFGVERYRAVEVTDRWLVAEDEVARVRCMRDDLATVTFTGTIARSPPGARSPSVILWNWEFIRAGWPWRALEGWRMHGEWGRTTAMPSMTMGDAIEIDGALVPVRPMCPGFVASSALYGGIAFALSLVPGTVRRWSRRRRGACIRCGYDLHASTNAACPECGAAA